MVNCSKLFIDGWWSIYFSLYDVREVLLMSEKIEVEKKKRDSQKRIREMIEKQRKERKQIGKMKIPKVPTDDTMGEA